MFVDTKLEFSIGNNDASSGGIVCGLRPKLVQTRNDLDKQCTVL